MYNTSHFYFYFFCTKHRTMFLYIGTCFQTFKYISHKILFRVFVSCVLYALLQMSPLFLKINVFILFLRVKISHCVLLLRKNRTQEKSNTKNQPHTLRYRAHNKDSEARKERALNFMICVPCIYCGNFPQEEESIYLQVLFF